MANTPVIMSSFLASLSGFALHRRSLLLSQDVPCSIGLWENYILPYIRCPFETSLSHPQSVLLSQAQQRMR